MLDSTELNIRLDQLDDGRFIGSVVFDCDFETGLYVNKLDALSELSDYLLQVKLKVDDFLNTNRVVFQDQQLNFCFDDK